ncbi:hypothetical protein Pelo_7271 [Pelomyxa schiedti]|nr:hypothetical protein Pelo_7271 [Pelomyxa schiedti]
MVSSWLEGYGLCAVVYCCLGAQVIIGGALEPPPGQSMQSFLVLFSLEGLSMCALLVALYLIVARTFLFSAGLFGEVVRKFKSFLGITAINFVFTLAVRFYRVVLVIDMVPPVAIWDWPGYFPLYIIQKIVQHVYFMWVLVTLYRLKEPTWYQADTSAISRLFHS